MNTIDEKLIFFKALIEERLQSVVPISQSEDKQLYEAARYALLNGGKRIRPILTLATAELFETDPIRVLIPACAIELIHTYSMIHDDLPCMDDDDFRRGKPSLHKQFDEATAVLAGDYLLTRAFEILAQESTLDEQTRLKVIQVIAKASGGEGMIGGQIIDIASEGKMLSLDLLEELHVKKTGALITAAVECGCIAASASSMEKELAVRFASSLGLAFQIVDDILDLTTGKNKRGEGASSDLENNKCTFATLHGVENAQAIANQLIETSMAALDQLPGDKSLLRELGRFILRRDH